MQKKQLPYTYFQLKNRAGYPESAGLYDPAFEHDSCGIGLIAAVDGVSRPDLVTNAIQILANLEHRGAVGGDKATGDGAGLLLGLPDDFLRREAKSLNLQLPPPDSYAVAMVFLPTDPEIAGLCMKVMQKAIVAEGMRVLGWRSVPVNVEGLGELARTTMPEFKQLFVDRAAVDSGEFEKKTYVIRRQVEEKVAALQNVDTSQFYIASFSSRTIVYKGMLTGTQLKQFFPDLTDSDFVSSFAIVHQRYSTNTLPTWSMAQPFRMLAHNGEINTLRGNISRMHAREATLSSSVLGTELEKLKPIIVENGSDSSVLDNVLELLVSAGRSLPHAMMMMVPEAWGSKYDMSEDIRAFYDYHSAIMEPWDGPAALVFTDGRYLGATLDRNGLRPARYTITKDGLLVLASETGVLDLDPGSLVYRGRLQPGKMLLLDLKQHRIVPDREIKAGISRRKPYRHWLKDNRIELRGLGMPAEIAPEPVEQLLFKQLAFGYTEEELKMVIAPMAARGQEAIGSMGNDTPLAVLSNRPQLLFSYFKQLFAQVTNPPIDPLREELVMSLMSYVGKEKNILEETPAHCRMLKLHHPILTPEDMIRLRNSKHPELATHDLKMLFPAGSGGAGLQQALQNLFEEAEAAVRDGAALLILSDKCMNQDLMPIPTLLAVSGLHHYLTKRGLRTSAGIIVESGETREVIHFAMLIGYGANAVCPHLAFSTVYALSTQQLLDPQVAPDTAIDNYISAVKKGLLKTLSRMGISTIRSFLGSQTFEAVGLGKNLVDSYFTGTSSRIGGIGLDELVMEAEKCYGNAYPRNGRRPKLLDTGGQYHLRRNGEKHLWTPEVISALQQATRNDDYKLFKKYCSGINDQSRQHLTLRSLIHFKSQAAVPLEEVESVDEIVKRFVVSAMSFGSLSREAHETIAVAMNRLGARSNSGEGGEDPSRFKIMPNGDSKKSRVKQIASGRFGVTASYLINADELQIKIAQGAKPGEGGQLPGHKVTAEIARVRHTMPGVTLISPPPHHDIYSIEDLAQLIYDLKCINPVARVSVKLVSEVGVGTIAAGVAKARADMVQIAGHDGGTGASPLTAIKHAGLPWELGLTETQQTLQQNGLRDKIRVQVDGQLRTGRDLAIAALMGAEEFGFATPVLVTLGCVMMRKCHSNTCPVGVATQDPKLRAHFGGKADFVVKFFRFLAEDLREQMSLLGFRKLDDMIGRVDVLEFQEAIDQWKTKGLDLQPMLMPLKNSNLMPRHSVNDMDVRQPVSCFDDTIIPDLEEALDERKPKTLTLPIRNVNRTVGARLAFEIVKRHGPQGLPNDTITLNFEGSAGQSLGAFLPPGVVINVRGDVNDYLGKGASGGRIVVTPHPESKLTAHQSVIAGNVILYGATGGEVYIQGVAGERFAVRNSGAKAVVEGVGEHCCEYMTGGIVVVLGATGNNFAAGMSGGIAYVYDESGLFDTKCNLDMVDIESVWRSDDQIQLRKLIEDHLKYTGSSRAQMILENWIARLPYFVKVLPIDYRMVLERMRHKEDRETETVSATEEVFPVWTGGL